MIPRKVAQRLLEDYIDRLSRFEGTPVAAELAMRETLADSDWVLRGAENVQQKARRYLTEGRLTVTRIERATGAVVAVCRGSDSAVYKLGFDPKGTEWRCTCPNPRPSCAHLAALRMIVQPPIGGRVG